MTGNEILSKSQYFVFLKGRHRKAKDKTKVHYSIKCKSQYYLPYHLEDDDVDRIRKIVDPNKNWPNQRKFEWHFKDYEKANKIFIILMLSGY